jgi:hypothetical protein
MINLNEEILAQDRSLHGLFDPRATPISAFSDETNENPDAPIRKPPVMALRPDDSAIPARPSAKPDVEF